MTSISAEVINYQKCMSSELFPSAERFESEKKKNLRKRIFSFPRTTDNYDDISPYCMSNGGVDLAEFIRYEEIAKLLLSNDLRSLTETILFDTVKQLITCCPREQKMPYEDEYVAMTLLTTCPRLIRMKDEEDDLLLVHYICIMEYPSHHILRFLVNEYHASVAIYGSLGDLHATPLHLKLMRTEINFEMVLFMLASCPHSARLETLHHKYPLHLALSVSPSSPRQQYFYHLTLQHLLAYHPEAAFLSVREEINCLSLVPEVSPQQDVNTSLPGYTSSFFAPSFVHDPFVDESDSSATVDEDEHTTIPHTPAISEGDAATVFIGQELYKVETKIVTWSPVEKARDSDDEQMKKLFAVHVDSFTRRHLHRQWRR